VIKGGCYCFLGATSHCRSCTQTRACQKHVLLLIQTNMGLAWSKTETCTSLNTKE